MSSWVGVGVMSGSSLDGLDLACVEFTGDYNTDTWSYRFLQAVTLSYDQDWQLRLRSADSCNGEQLAKLHADYGRFIGQSVAGFIEQYDLKPNFVASHGHTIFHQPENGFTFQLGDGETVAAFLRCPLVANFRSKDVALGGQGAPLVPVGETYLFSQYDICLNLGGIANISISNTGFDISVCNMLLNTLASLHDSQLEYDAGGQLAQTGQVLEDVLSQLNSLPYFSQKPPKSLGKEWFEKNIIPIITSQNYKPADLLRTSVEHITDQICQVLKLPPGRPPTPALSWSPAGALLTPSSYSACALSSRN